MKHRETHLVKATHQPRPGRAPERCSCCGVQVGSEHEADCIFRARTVVVRYTVEAVIAVPEDFDSEYVEMLENEWSCANKLTEVLGDNEANGCLCTYVRAAFVREATEEDEQRIDVPRVVFRPR